MTQPHSRPSVPELTLVLPLRRILPAATVAEVAGEIRALAGRHPTALSAVATATIPGLGARAVVAVRMMDPRGPTEICTVILGAALDLRAAQALRADLAAAIVAAPASADPAAEAA